MSGTPYIDGDTLNEAREAIRRGASLESVAGRLKTTPEPLAQLLGCHPCGPFRSNATGPSCGAT